MAVKDSVQRTAFSAQRNKAVIGANVTVMVVLALLLFGMANYFSARHYHRFDLTRIKIYSLSDQSKAILKELKGPIKITVFFQPTHALYGPMRELLQGYQYHGDKKVEVEFVDPGRDYARAKILAEKYKIDDMNLVIFESGDRNKYIGAQAIADYDYQGFFGGGAPKLKAFRGEEAFTSAILAVTEERKPSIYFMTGHGEKEIEKTDPAAGYSVVSQLLQHANFDVQEFSLLREGKIPQTADLVVLAGPNVALAEMEIQELGMYLDGGGKLLLMADPLTEPGLTELLKKHGIELGNDVIVDPAKKLPFVSPANVFITEYGSHPITEKIQGLATLFPLARSVSPAAPLPSDISVVELAKTTSYGWGEAKTAVNEFQFNEGEDKKGPVSIAVAMEKKLEGEKTARMVVIGDSDFISNSQLGNLGNKDFFFNIIHWLVQQEKKIAIGPKIPEQVNLNLNASQMGQVFWETIIGLPLLSLALGGAVLWRRRR